MTDIALIILLFFVTFIIWSMIENFVDKFKGR